MEALYINTTDRLLPTSFVSVTKSSTGLVIRKALSGPNLFSMRDGMIPMPVIIPVNGYQARSSAGFVKIFWGVMQSDFIVGECGFPRRGENDSAPAPLRLTREPLPCVVLARGAFISQVETHHNSNCRTRDASMKGIEWMVAQEGCVNCPVWIMEGQSDHVRAIRIAPNRDVTSVEFPPEHRDDMFTPEAIVRKTLCRGGWRYESQEGVEAAMLCRCAHYISGTEDRNSVLSRNVWSCIPDADVIVNSIFDRMREKGWILTVDMSLGNHFLRAISPDGEIFDVGNSLNQGTAAAQEKLIGMVASTLEEHEVERLREAMPKDPKKFISEYFGITESEN